MYVIFCIYHKICGYQKNSTVSYHLNCFHIKNLKQLLSNNLAIKLNKWISDKKNSTPGGLTSPMPRDISQKEEISSNCRVEKRPCSTYIWKRGALCTRYTIIGCRIGFHHISIITKYATVLWTHNTWWIIRCSKGH